ncbi:MAG: hypothetical protein V4471_06770 [Pseudomonadota bacterium]
MARTITFDTLQYAKKLKEAGISEKAAEIQAEALKDVIENNLATKRDIWELKRDIEVLKKDLTIRLGSMIAVSISILSVLLTLLNRIHY